MRFAKVATAAGTDRCPLTAPAALPLPPNGDFPREEGARKPETIPRREERRRKTTRRSTGGAAPKNGPLVREFRRTAIVSQREVHYEEPETKKNYNEVLPLAVGRPSKRMKEDPNEVETKLNKKSSSEKQSSAAAAAGPPSSC